MDETQFASLHSCLQEAAQAPREKKNAMPPFTFRIPDEIREPAEVICRMNGTSLPEFFRKCAEVLQREYKP